MSRISVQVSLYPLRQADLAPAIAKALEIYHAYGLEISPGAMSTVIVGEPEAIFDALKTSFQSSAMLGDVVMVASISNCCPIPAEDGASE